MLLLFIFVEKRSVAALDLTCESLKSYSSFGVQSFSKIFVNINDGTFNEWSNSTNSASYWNTFVALNLVADAYSLHLVEEKFFEDFVSAFYETFMEQGWGSGYYDDEDWAIEALVKTKALLKNQTIADTLTQVRENKRIRTTFNICSV